MLIYSIELKFLSIHILVICSKTLHFLLSAQGISPLWVLTTWNIMENTCNFEFQHYAGPYFKLLRTFHLPPNRMVPFHEKKKFHKNFSSLGWKKKLKIRVLFYFTINFRFILTCHVPTATLKTYTMSYCSYSSMIPG